MAIEPVQVARIRYQLRGMTAAALVIIVLLSLAQCRREDDRSADTVSAGAETPVEESLPTRVSFNRHVRPILNANCLACHGGVKANAGLSFLFREQAIVRGESGEWAIKPGDPAASYLLQRITDSTDPMPPADHGPMLTAREAALIRRWIEQGAQWEDHWAYVAPVRPTIPDVDDAWVRNDIDRFVLARLEQEQLKPSPPAEPATLLRRMALDLTGLPPTVEEYDSFLVRWEQDQAAAVSEAADRLLASPAFGERWAAMWLDLARYADTRGYEKDAGREVWKYRDYVIDSFNADKPYDRFVVEQLAGDLLPDAGVQQIAATTFNRNTQNNDEGGTDNEEFRISALIDRTNTTWSVFGGTTFGCIQCHAHPYDPFRHEDYYRFAAFLNNTQDNDDGDFPHFPIPVNDADGPRVLELRRHIDQLAEKRDARAKAAVDSAAWQETQLIAAATTGDGRMERPGSGAMLRVLGTIPWDATYSLDLAPPGPAVSAVRLDALVDADRIGKASPGFILSQLMLQHVAGDGATTDLPIAGVFASYSRSDKAVEEILKETPVGWADYPVQYQPHWLVAVPAKPVSLATGERLRVVLKHRTFTERTDAVLRHFRLRTSDDPSWIALAADAEQAQLSAEIAAAQQALEAIPTISQPVMLERRGDLLRDTHLFVRGNWMTLGEKVSPAVPGSLPQLERPPQGSGRLDMARWFASPENPLTARVHVNRLWEQLFGVGLVATGGDFGTFGDRPSHPELLDWLAVRLMTEHGWRIKPMLREIVISATYAQSAVADSAAHERDPRNRLLARGPRQRLTAEMIRDQALLASGLLSRKLHGPPVMPPQPEGVWQSVYSAAAWKTSEGEDRYRRAIYTYWKRTSPYPSLMTFDVPTREFCTTERVNTNTPLQALVTLNDPAFHECAQHLARRMLTATAETAGQIDAGYRLLTGKSTPEAVLAELSALYDAALVEYGAAQPASQPATQPAATPQESAMTLVAATLLNLDEVMTR